ncbi:hypothetical protein [Haloarcula sp. JP-L23]|uniref:hypothetical protein n=1 Tax=Haloarcula sp. JP-L23 TaxID=2716717 RepID=UPI00140F45F2|nr:hypothetical protein G9465_24760 [Haloarcula sp. JP-L23]
MTPTIAGPDGTDDADEPGGRTCFGCRETFETEQHAYREVFGEVADVTDHGLVFGTTGGVPVRHWCRACWNRERGREKAAHYDVTDGDRLWAILDAADGALVADLMPILVGGRAWIRVVDGDVEARHTTRERTDEGGIRFGTEPSEDFDVTQFGEFFDEPTDMTCVLLKPADETPFAEVDG